MQNTKLRFVKTNTSLRFTAFRELPRVPHRREPRIGAIAGAKDLPGSAFAPPEYPYTRSFSNRMPVLSSLSGHEVNDGAQAAVGPRRCPPKARVCLGWTAFCGRTPPARKVAIRQR